MKKTLIALAVLAASGASFAQVTVSGNLTMGYQAASDAAKNDTAGFGVDTSEIDFTATEDLGGGLKAVAKLALAGADRSGESNSKTTGGVTGRDASLTLSGGFGALALGSEQEADYLSGGLAGVGAYYSGFNGKVFSARVNRDTVTYVLPTFAKGLTLAYSYQEAAVAGIQGLGAGTTGAASTTDQSRSVFVVAYEKGPLALSGQYAAYAARIDNSNTSIKDVTRLSGAYDFGVVKLGLGAQVAQSAGTAKQTDLLAGLSVPVGALTLGAQFAQRKTDDAGVTASGTQSGTALQATYGLSKRTSVIGNYARWDSVVGAANASSQYQLFLSHSF